MTIDESSLSDGRLCAPQISKPLLYCSGARDNGSFHHTNAMAAASNTETRLLRRDGVSELLATLLLLPSKDSREVGRRELPQGENKKVAEQEL